MFRINSIDFIVVVDDVNDNLLVFYVVLYRDMVFENELINNMVVMV